MKLLMYKIVCELGYRVFEIIIALVILFALFDAGYAHCEEECNTRVRFDSKFIPEEKIGSVFNAMMWVMTEFPELVECTEVKINYVPLGENIWASVFYSDIFGYNLHLSSSALSLSENNMRSVLLHEFRHVYQNENKMNNNYTLECGTVKDEIDATLFEIANAERTKMSVEMMIDSTIYLLDQIIKEKELCLK